MGPGGIYPRVLTEVADVVARPLSIIFEKLWQSGSSLMTGRGKISYPSRRIAQKRTQETTGPSALLQSLGKWWNDS